MIYDDELIHRATVAHRMAELEKMSGHEVRVRYYPEYVYVELRSTKFIPHPMLFALQCFGRGPTIELALQDLRKKMVDDPEIYAYGSVL